MPASENPTSGLVHARLERQTGLSAFGVLLHLARLNHFHGPDFRAAFGLHFTYQDDLSKHLTFSAKNQARLATAAAPHVESKNLWGAEPWQPFVGEDFWKAQPWSLRACPCCLRFGYHSNLFQMPWMTRCPWHRTQLITDCRKCGRRLLDGFRQGLDLMRCPCGSDPVNELAVLKGDPQQADRGEFMDAYLAWARAERQRRVLMVPEQGDAGGPEALAALISPSCELERWRDSFSTPTKLIHVDRLRRRDTITAMDAHAFSTMLKCANSLWPGQAGMADLPVDFSQPLIGVSRQIASRVPGTSLTTREREALALEPVARTASAPSRHDILFLPVQRVTKGLYLDVRVLHRAAYHVIAHLSWRLITNDPARDYPKSGSHRLLLVAIQHALCRAYSDAFKHVLGRHVPAIYDHSRFKAGPRLPWVLVRSDLKGAIDVQLAWTPRGPWDEIQEVRTRKGKRPPVRLPGASTRK